MLELQSTLLCIFFAFILQFSIADTQEPREVHPRLGPWLVGNLNPQQKDNPSLPLRRLSKDDAGPLRPHGQHPPDQLINDPGPQRHSRKSDDLGPHRPGGQVPPNDNIRLTPLEILSARKLGQRLSNPISRDNDIGPHRPGGQHPASDSSPKRPTDESVSLEKRNYLNRQSSVRTGEVSDERTGTVFSHDLDIDIGPQRSHGQHPAPSDHGPQRPHGQHPPESTTFVSSDSHEGHIAVKRTRRDLDQKHSDAQISPNDETIFSFSAEIFADESTDANSEVSPYAKILNSDTSGSSKIAEGTNGINRPTRRPQDVGPHRPMGSLDPNGISSPPIDLGPQRPSGQHPPSISISDSKPVDLGPHRPSGATDPNGVPLPPIDLGPQRPFGQHSPSTNTSQVMLPSGHFGPQRLNGAIDPNGVPTTPSDLGPQRPSGQHHPLTGNLGPQRPSGQHPSGSTQKIVSEDPVQDASQNIVLRLPPADVGPHRPSGTADPNGVSSPPTDLGPQRPSGQFPPSTEDLGPHRPSGQHLPQSKHSPPTDLGPHRPSETADPNGVSSPPTDLGPQRPSGQVPLPTEDWGPHRPPGQHPPSPETLVTQKPFGQHPNSIPSLPSDLGSQRPTGQHSSKDESQKITELYSPQSDLGPHRPSGSKDPNGIPSPPNYQGSQRPSGQHPSKEREQWVLADPYVEASQTDFFYFSPIDLGPHRPSGAKDPNGVPSPPSDLGPQRPSGQLPPTSDIHRVIVLNAPSVDPGPLNSKESESLLFPLDLGPQRPSGQQPPPEDNPLRVESTALPPSVDLGPHRPAGITDPNIKPAIENDQEQSMYNVYWNVPTFMCHKHGYPFRNLSGEYGIVQNPDDVFRGSRVTILYDPGLFPAVLQNEKGEKFLRNGGVPQEGDIQKHLAALEDSIEEQVPKDFDGLGVIDFEAWRPVWAQNWGTLNIYRTVSIDLEKRRDPGATRRALEIRAKARFEAAARVFFTASLQLAQQLRPHGRWGFYGFPHCFNQVPTRPADYTCAPQHQHQNDKIDWLWKTSTALYPSVYLTKANKTSQDELAFVSGRLTEAQRISRGLPVYAYVWYRYHDTGSFLTEDDLRSSLNVPRQLSLAGTILWGSSSDLNNREKCARFSQVLENSIGPAVARATGRRVRESEAPTVIFAT